MTDYPIAHEPDESPDVSKFLDAWNEKALQSATQLAENDIDASKRANQVLIYLSAASGVAALILLGSLFFVNTPNGYIATIGAGVALISTLVAGLITKPLQVIERDTVFRRWSDTIRSAYLMSVANGEAHLPNIVAAGTEATAQYGLLAASYAILASKDVSDLGAVFGATSAAVTGSPSPSGVALTNPGPQTGAVGSAALLKISAGGPDDLTLVAEGVPEGIFFSSASATFSGKPVRDGTYSVTVAAATNSDPKSAIVANFVWTVAKGDASQVFSG
jgi:hypothetical protein